MSEALRAIIAKRIQEKGGISVAEYMNLCLGHPEHGYYNTRDPFGVSGDFVTAPEISQMFGEMLGVWVVDSWIKIGSPNPFYLVEFGPGRGTLMHDIIRATKNRKDFQQAVNIHLVEMSPVLRKKQEETLKAYDRIEWHNDVKTLPHDAPVVIIGNEFLDALPIHQYCINDATWHEVVVENGKNASFRYGVKLAKDEDVNQFPSMLFPPSEGDHLEVSFAQSELICDLSKMIIKQGGIALFIDYGFTMPVYGTTLQAVMHHRYSNVLDNVGEGDLSAHVNFAHLGEVILQNNMTLHGTVSQRNFLMRLGIETRAAYLKKNASGQQAQDIDLALMRLIGNDTKNNQMGELFKVIAFTADDTLQLEGFT